MTPVFTIGFLEALECSLALLVLAALPVLRRRFASLLGGALLGMVTGAAISYLPPWLPAVHNEALWGVLRHSLEIALFLVPVFLLWLESKSSPALEGISVEPFLALLGFSLTVFDARLTSLVVHESALMLESPLAAPAVAALGAALALSMLMVIRLPGLMEKIRTERFFTPASVLLAAATLRLLTGGVDAIDETHTIEALRLGIQGLFTGISIQTQDALMLTPLEFIPTAAAGVFKFLSGEQMATTALVLLLTAPPVLVLMAVLSRPDPDLSQHEQAAQRRLHLAFFRMDMVMRGAPPLICFFLVLGALHLVTAGLNPMNEPRPVPLTESTEHAGVLSIPVSGPYGDFSDGMLRKFSFRYGQKVIRFLAIMKPDGTVGAGLDECEICNPPQWNEKALGYAQRGDHLVCKYCMTPIPTNTLNMPGGCNPIPLSFTMEEGRILIETDELIRVWREAQKLDKKGSHL